MGKNGKLRKKRRLESVGDVAVLPGGAATAGRDSGAKAGAGTSAAATGTAAVAMVAGAVAKPDLDAAVRVLATLSHNAELLRHPDMRLLRKAVTALTYHAARGGGAITELVASRNWPLALDELQAMGRRADRMKLGTFQRLVRECDAAGTDDPDALRVLDAILRVCQPKFVSDCPLPHYELSGDGVMRRYPPFNGLPDVPMAALTPGAAADVRPMFRCVAYERGCDRNPPNKFDLQIWASKRGTVSLAPPEAPVAVVPVPHVPGACLYTNVLSAAECASLVAAAEGVGYEPDEPLAGQPGASVLAHACVWLVDSHLHDAVFSRIGSLLPGHVPPARAVEGDCAATEGGVPLPATACGTSAVETAAPLPAPSAQSAGVAAYPPPRGLNRRWRFYRYVPGRYYRPHIDGAWPPSGLVPPSGVSTDGGCGASATSPTACDAGADADADVAGTYAYDCSGGTQMSRFTALLYLNEGFDGGCTTFFTPSTTVGVMNAFPVTPRAGCMLLFPHGSVEALLHEGSPVLHGMKYVVRTEVEYDFDASVRQ